MSRQAQWDNVRLTERGRSHGSKSDGNGRSATPTTAIPNSGELAGDCGFAYPLLVYWNRSLSVPLFPSLSIYSKIIPSPSPFRLLSRPLVVVVVVLLPLSLSAPFILSRTPFVVLSSTQSSRPSAPASASHCPPRLHLPSLSLSLASSLVLVSRSLSTYFYLSAIRRADPRPRTQSPPVPGFYYEIRDSPPASSRFTHTYPHPVYVRRTATPRRAAPSRYTLANFANVGSRRITHLQQYRFFLHPRSAPRRDTLLPIILYSFIATKI